MAEDSKQKVKITPVKAPETVFTFTCPRCGAHNTTKLVVTTGKFSGLGIGYTKVTICRACGFGQELEF